AQELRSRLVGAERPLHRMVRRRRPLQQPHRLPVGKAWCARCPGYHPGGTGALRGRERDPLSADSSPSASTSTSTGTVGGAAGCSSLPLCDAFEAEAGGQDNLQAARRGFQRGAHRTVLATTSGSPWLTKSSYRWSCTSAQDTKVGASGDDSQTRIQAVER